MQQQYISPMTRARVEIYVPFWWKPFLTYAWVEAVSYPVQNRSASIHSASYCGVPNGHGTWLKLVVSFLRWKEGVELSNREGLASLPAILVEPGFLGGPERWLWASVIQADGFLATLAELGLQSVTPGLCSGLGTLGAVGQTGSNRGSWLRPPWPSCWKEFWGWEVVFCLFVYVLFHFSLSFSFSFSPCYIHFLKNSIDFLMTKSAHAL